MLTNWKTISNSIKTLEKIEKDLANEELGLNKKEKLVLERDRLKLESALGGIRNMGGHPDLIIIIDIRREINALNEAKKLGIPVVAVVDTNCNPDPVDFVIPGNDDSRQSIELFYHLISSAILCWIEESASESGVKNIDKIESKVKSAKKEEKKPEPKKDKIKDEETEEVKIATTNSEEKIEEVAKVAEVEKTEVKAKAKAKAKAKPKTKAAAKTKAKAKAKAKPKTNAK